MKNRNIIFFIVLLSACSHNLQKSVLPNAGPLREIASKKELSCAESVGKLIEKTEREKPIIIAIPSVEMWPEDKEVLKNLTKMINSDQQLKEPVYAEQFNSLLIKATLPVEKNYQIRGARRFLNRELSTLETNAIAMANALDYQVNDIKISVQEIVELQKRRETILELAGFSTDERKVLFEKGAVSTHVDTVMENLMRYNVKTANLKEVQISNEKLLDELDHFTPTETNRSTVAIDLSEAKKIYNAVSNNEVASIQNISKYDPKNEGIGFCFGRATTAHLEALHRRVNPFAIKKIFAVGELKAGETNWGFHVTTIVRAKTGGWYAIDPIMGRPINLREWYKIMSDNYDPSKSMKIFATDANRFVPHSSDHYLPSSLFISGYHGYFEDLMKYFRARSDMPRYQFRTISLSAGSLIFSGTGISSILFLQPDVEKVETSADETRQLLILLVNDHQYAVTQKSIDDLVTEQILDDEAETLITNIQADFKVPRKYAVEKISNAYHR